MGRLDSCAPRGSAAERPPLLIAPTYWRHRVGPLPPPFDEPCCRREHPPASSAPFPKHTHTLLPAVSLTAGCTKPPNSCRHRCTSASAPRCLHPTAYALASPILSPRPTLSTLQTQLPFCLSAPLHCCAGRRSHSAACRSVPRPLVAAHLCTLSCSTTLILLVWPMRLFEGCKLAQHTIRPALLALFMCDCLMPPTPSRVGFFSTHHRKQRTGRPTARAASSASISLLHRTPHLKSVPSPLSSDAALHHHHRHYYLPASAPITCAAQIASLLTLTLSPARPFATCLGNVPQPHSTLLIFSQVPALALC